MPRIARLIVKGEPTVYHVISRTALDGFVLGDIEKEYFLNLIRRLSKVYFAEVLGFCLMGTISISWSGCIPAKFTTMRRSRPAFHNTMAMNLRSRSVTVKSPTFERNGRAFPNMWRRSSRGFHAFTTEGITGKVSSGPTATRIMRLSPYLLYFTRQKDLMRKMISIKLICIVFEKSRCEGCIFDHLEDDNYTFTLSEYWKSWKIVKRFFSKPIDRYMGHTGPVTVCPAKGTNYKGAVHSLVP